MKFSISVFLLFFVILFSCSNDQQGNTVENFPPDSFIVSKEVYTTQRLSELGFQLHTTTDYDETKNEIQKQLQKIKKADKDKFDPKETFSNILLNKIIPHWYGTKWSFNGHTSIPKSGEIACGYFVSTTLQDAGLNVNRFQLAQQSPIHEAESIALESDVQIFDEETPSKSIEKMRAQLDEGVYFIGLEKSHVGFLIKRERSLILIHSNYLDQKGVDIEFAEDSKVFNAFRQFFIAPITENQTLMDSWRLNIEIPIQKGDS